jgi:hypothetical protein
MPSPETGLALWVALSLVALVVYPASLIWAYRDARRRGTSETLVTLLVAVTWPLGLAAWVVLRRGMSKKTE